MIAAEDRSNVGRITYLKVILHPPPPPPPGGDAAIISLVNIIEYIISMIIPSKVLLLRFLVSLLCSSSLSRGHVFFLKMQ